MWARPLENQREPAEGPARRGRSALLGDLVWAFLGTGIPMLVAVVAIPPLVHGMGDVRFGILSLAWIVLGYFNLFDLGLSRAMTQLVALKIGSGEEGEVTALFWGGMTLMAGFALVGALTLWLITPLLVSRIVLPDNLRAEATASFQLLSIGIPFVIGATGLRGLLEGRQRFDLVNIVRIPTGMLTFLGPLAVLPFTHALPLIVATLVVARAVSMAVYSYICWRLYPELRKPAAVEPKLVKTMLTFGGWMTLSNVAGPLLLYLGRMMIAFMISAEALAYFSTPYDVVVNLLVIPTTLVSVYYPRFAQDAAAGGAGVRTLYRQAQALNVAALLPLSILTYLLAKPALDWWIGIEFSARSHLVAEIIVVGVFINSFGHISQALVQAHNRPDLTAKLHFFELVLYVPYLWLLVSRYGITGAAVAWVIRVFLSTLVLAVLANMCMSGANRAVRMEQRTPV